MCIRDSSWRARRIWVAARASRFRNDALDAYSLSIAPGIVSFKSVTCFPPLFPPSSSPTACHYLREIHGEHGGFGLLLAPVASKTTPWMRTHRPLRAGQSVLKASHVFLLSFPQSAAPRPAITLGKFMESTADLGCCSRQSLPKRRLGCVLIIHCARDNRF